LQFKGLDKKYLNLLFKGNLWLVESFINGIIDFYVMDVKFLKEEKNEIEFELDNVTLMEILRVYLNKEAEVTFVAWKKEHQTTVAVMKVETKTKDAKSMVKDAIKAIVSDVDGVVSDFKSLK
jgi:DNA-directed RNA polymerase subunit L